MEACRGLKNADPFKGPAGVKFSYQASKFGVASAGVALQETSYLDLTS
jgi:hypothetical protein